MGWPREFPATGAGPTNFTRFGEYMIFVRDSFGMPGENRQVRTSGTGFVGRACLFGGSVNCLFVQSVRPREGECVC